MVKSRGKKKKRTVPKTRKELRKEKRLEKKINKRKFFSNNQNPGKYVKNLAEGRKSELVTDNNVHDEVIESDFDLSDEDHKIKLKKVSEKSSSVAKPDRFHENQQREKKNEKELRRKMRKQRIEQLKVANEDDEKIIRKLEKRLRIDKHRNENSVHKMFNDGLDYALELCLPENIEKMYAAAKEAAVLEQADSEEDFEEDMIIALGKNKGKIEKFKNDNLQENERKSKLCKIEQKYFKNDLESDFSGFDSEFQESDEECTKSNRKIKTPTAGIIEEDIKHNEIENEVDDDLSTVYSDNEGSFYEIDELETKHREDGLTQSDNDPNTSTIQTWEDIYGRKRDKEGNVLNEITQKYIPPHVRMRLQATENLDEKQKEKLERLMKHCKGFLNRLSEANMHKIASEIENVYRNNPRFDVNNTINRLFMESLVTNILSKERMVLEHAMLVAVLHGKIGSEIGAQFLQVLISKFHELIQEVKTLRVDDKKLDNIVFLLSHFYTFKIMQHSLIFEIVNKLIENLCEKTVECILLVLRSVGFQLRKDDPGQLKELILSIQKKASESSLEIKENPRLKFMLDVLNAIKNNNMTKIPNYDPSLAEHLKKLLKSLLTNGKYIATLNITMDDLLRADENGKWWIIGSAWTGNIKDIGSANQGSKNKSDTEKFSEKLLTLARKQRMNTEDRRNVFCIIMSAEDYVDAFERLLHLAIKDHRVIPSIIIHCCLSEMSFNPYYAVLGQKFCEHDRKYQLALQFATWDRIKDLQSATKTQIMNLAQFLLHLIINGGLPISVLKVVDFAQLDKVTLRLVRQIILGLLLGKEEDCKQVFTRIAPSAKLNTFKDCVRLFMHHFLLKSGSKKHVPREQLELLKTRITLADSVLSYIDSRVKF